MTSTEDIGAELDRAAVTCAPLPGGGWEAICPCCGAGGVMQWREGDQGWTCRNGCHPSTIADTLHSRANRPFNDEVAKVPEVPTPYGAGTSGTLRRCDLAHMLATDPEPIDWLVQGVVARGYLSLFVGREKTGKSLLGLATSARCAEGGGTVAGIQCADAKVLYLDCENGSREIHRRVRALGLSTSNRLVVYEGVGFNVATGLDEVDQILTDVKPDLFWLDSWRSMWAGDENSAQEASRVLDPLRELIRRHNVGAGLLHHANKLGQYRGSTAVGASVESIVEFVKADGDEDRRRRLLRNSACRFEQEADDRWVRIEADRSRGLVLIDEAEPYKPSTGRPHTARDETEEVLLATLNGSFTSWSDWARAAGLDPKNGTARRARDELANRGAVSTAQGLWRRADPNREAV
jgi:KaiC/GvpD/RAD55 family RecA-like ATPase